MANFYKPETVRINDNVQYLSAEMPFINFIHVAIYQINKNTQRTTLNRHELSTVSFSGTIFPGRVIVSQGWSHSPFTSIGYGNENADILAGVNGQLYPINQSNVVISNKTNNESFNCMPYSSYEGQLTVPERRVGQIFPIGGPIYRKNDYIIYGYSCTITIDTPV